MSEHDDRQDEGTDPHVSRAYREGSDERTPAHLDRAIVRQATDEVRDAPSPRLAWFRPLAFAATLVLGVALLYDMQSQTGSGGTVPGTLSDMTTTEEGSADASEAQDGPPAARQLDAPRAAAPAESRPELPTRYKPSGRRSGEQSAQEGEREALDPTATMKRNDAAPDDQPKPAGEAASRATEDVAAPFTERRLLETRERREAAYATDPADSGDSPRCTTDESADADSWWRCIERLREAGSDEAADRELEHLYMRYPDYEPDDRRGS